MWGSATASSSPLIRNYSTGCATGKKPNVVNRLEGLFSRSQAFPKNAIDRDLYKLICDKELLLIAYSNLKSKPGQLTPGITPTTLDGMSDMLLDQICSQLRDESFRFQPGRRIQIPKVSGGIRPLTIAPPRDKLVQEAMRMVLEAVFEPNFSDYSHGFRPKRSCHTALLEVSKNFQTAT
jgi:retron-type reverse transcriptase